MLFVYIYFGLTENLEKSRSGVPAPFFQSKERTAT